MLGRRNDGTGADADMGVRPSSGNKLITGRGELSGAPRFPWPTPGTDAGSGSGERQVGGHGGKRRHQYINT
jgi:hypothetical protein